MINHTRTLLMNVDGGPVPAVDALPGERTIDASYRKLDLPTYLDEVRAKLFGPRPDRAMLNYRCCQFMTLLHATRLGLHYVTAPDARITYGNGRQDLFAREAFTPAYSPMPGSVDGDVIAFLGTPNPPDPVGQAYHEFVVGASGGSASVEQWAPGHRLDSLALGAAQAGGYYANPVPLGSTGYQVLLRDVVGAAGYRVRFVLRPVWTLGQLVESAASAGEPTLLRLFGASPVEPYRTFRNLFFDNRELVYRLGGLLLALAYRTDEVRRGSGG